MSWIKRRGQNSSPSPAPVGQQLTEPVPMYNPNQAWQPNNWYQQKQQSPAPQQNYWDQQGYRDQQNQQLQNQNAQHFQQYPDQNTMHNQQTFGNHQYNQQYNAQNNSFQEVTLQNNESDSWGNWEWGDEDNSNIQAVPSEQGAQVTAAFANDEAWNWSVDESANQRKNQAFGEDTTTKDIFPRMGKPVASNNTPDQQNPREIEDSSLLSLSSGKANKLGTPQWSVDSQVSQESSDDILQTSESDNHLVSGSTLSHSPLSGFDNLQPLKDDPVPESASLTYQHVENRENVSLGVNPPQSSYNTQSHQSLGSTSQDNSIYNKTSNLTQKNASTSHGFQNLYSESVNLETLPDNSEHPDVPHSTKTFSSVNPTQRFNQSHNFQDNSEVPMNDRNQYLETGQLSDANQLDFSSNADADSSSLRSNQEDTLPPPGLRRMVLGQIGQQDAAGNVENFNDEPPPGLRVVLGQNENNLSAQVNASLSNKDSSVFEPISPPEGLRRMIPGESSSPENSLNQAAFHAENIDTIDSDQDYSQIPQLRSATIGADMPQASALVSAQSLSSSNRSETIGAADSSEKPGVPSISPANNRKPVRKSKDKKVDSQRRNYIEGQTVEDDMSSVVSGIRNLTVGENLIDDNKEINKSEARRKLSRQDTSESENENRGKSSRDRKDRRHRGDRKERDYSPDPSRDRRYDRRKYRDRHYEESADYLSDGEHDKSRDKDYDKKYYSLRKDKERDRKRRESPREYDRERRKREEYYHRYDDSFENEERSRPSSRSDSMHDSMYRGERRGEKDSKDRRRDRPRDREKHRRSRDSYNPYGQNYGGYDPYHPYYQQYQYQYYENLRRTNPQAYAEIYRKYYEQHAARQPQAYGPDDRSSVHSGRSSANEELAADRYTRQSYYSQSSMQYLGGYYPRDSKTNSISGHYDLDESSFFKPKHQNDSYDLDESSAKLGRETPAKFVTAHMKASICSGRLIKILPNYPQDGQPAVVELADLQTYLQKDGEFKELSTCPGPLTKDVTHKKTVIEYCENKIKDVSANLDVADQESYILMWEFLILMLRQNGKVVGTDIAELLLKNQTENVPPRPSSVLSNLSSNPDHAAISEHSTTQLSEGKIGAPASTFKEEDVTNKFREYLLYGSDQEALEWAMKHGLWGHALFLASKLGKRTYSNVMVRFANGLTLNDPLQTLYQLLSGKMPAVVNGVADEKWGDWKPHLAMILSNSSLQPDLNRKAITSLGDTLLARGSLYAAQFCYLMAEVSFGKYGMENVKIVLLGSDHRKPFSYFATNEAIHMTEIYEYACSLNDPEFAIPELQVYKYLIATRLADHGFLEKSLAYLEKLALYIIMNPSSVQSSLIHNVYNLADRLKYYDPIGAEEDDENYDKSADNRLDNSWLRNLRLLLSNVDSGVISTLDTRNDMTITESNQPDLYTNIVEENQPNPWQNNQIYNPQYTTDNSQLQWQQEEQSQIDTSLDTYQQTGQHLEGYSTLSYQNQQQNYWPNQQPQEWESNGNQVIAENQDVDKQNYYAPNTPNEDEGKPQISIPNQSRGKSIFDDEPLPHEKKGKNPSKIETTKQQQNSSGWFGGIFSKLALKPKNQMKLPDDKNPSIVWDEEKKRWINVDEDNNGKTGNDVKPPPKISDLKPISPNFQSPAGLNNSPMPQTQAYSNPVSYDNGNISSQIREADIPRQFPSLPSPENSSQQANIFKLQKNRNLKKSYIDVFNPGGNAKVPAPLPNMPSFPAANAMPQMNLFIPQPVNDPNAPTNFLTQGAHLIQPQHEETAQLSRWSSASSLSKEVQHYMRHKPPNLAS